jgi:hypothetical protein
VAAVDAHDLGVGLDVAADLGPARRLAVELLANRCPRRRWRHLESAGEEGLRAVLDLDRELFLHRSAIQTVGIERIVRGGMP